MIYTIFIVIIHRLSFFLLKTTCCFTLLLISSCASIPGEELNTYREAFLQSQRAGELLYDELNSAVIKAGGDVKAKSCMRVQNNLPKCFDPKIALDEGSVANPNILARLLALKALETYNLAIVDLLEGKRGDVASTRINELRNTAVALIELTSITTGPVPALIGGQGAALLGQLVKQLDSLATRQQVRASLIKNAPVVQELITLLIDDTSDMYKLYKTTQGKYAVELELEVGSSNKAVKTAYRDIGSYHDQLTAYVKLLNQTNIGFKQLVTALQSSKGTLADTRATIQESIKIKNAAEAFWAEMRKVRAN